MKVGVITQARMTSTRLPGKVLLPLGDTTVLGMHLDRLATSSLLVVVATTTNQTDDAVVETVADAAVGRDVAVHRGSESDVLQRFLDAATAHDLDAVVRVTSDCPLIDGRLIAEAVAFWVGLEDDMAYVSNTIVRTYPRGFDLEIFSVAALRVASLNARSRSDREHVTPYLYAGVNDDITCYPIGRRADGAADIRLTIDTRQDYEMLRELVSLVPGVATMHAEDIVAELRRHPEIVRLNAEVQQKCL